MTENVASSGELAIRCGEIGGINAWWSEVELELARTALDHADHSDHVLDVKAKEIGTLEAKTRLSELLDKVEAGQRCYITRHGRPVAELGPLPQKGKKPRFGCGKGMVTFIAPDFDAPLEDFAEYVK